MKELNLDNPCLEQEELDGITHEGPDARQAAHLENCAACRTLLASYRSFFVEDMPAEGADPEDAKVRLEGFIDELTDAPPVERTDPGFVRAFLHGPGRNPAWRPALAALLVVAVGGLWWLAGNGGETLQPSGVLRDGSTETAANFAITATAGAGGWNLSWTPAPGADGYRVRILDASLQEILLLDASPTWEYALLRADHPELDGAGPFFASIEAVKAGDLMLRTELVELSTGAP